jgi:hypothetical protein
VTYVGRPWRSRFLRAPKHGLELTNLGGFTPLGSVASVGLGMKTGADAFFYLTPLSDVEEQKLKEDEGLERRPPGSIAVEGLENWKGFISSRDLRPAIRNPHELYDESDRRFRIPAATGVYYLYPRDRAPQGDLARYIELGELRRINQGRLVRSNAAGNRWYRQARAIVDSPIALPYNSAYDYGAWDNHAGAVLNGRFLGVTANDGVDAELLLAALNSTFVILTRLLEGVATGVEAAFDVGPPAARLMMIPDPRRFDSGSTEKLRSLVTEHRSRDLMPPSPARDAQVHELRKRLDLAIMEALGFPAGDASYHVGRVYESYARWRRSVEDVEARMRVHRRSMNRGGSGSGGLKPLEILGRRIWEELSPRVRLFPSDVLSRGDAVEPVDIARRYHRPEQEPLIEPGRVETSDGGEADLGSWNRVRYASMMLRIGYEPPVIVPVDDARAGRVVDDYEREAAFLEGLARQEAGEVVDAEGVAVICRVVLKEWHQACRESASA